MGLGDDSCGVIDVVTNDPGGSILDIIFYNCLNEKIMWFIGLNFWCDRDDVGMMF